MLSDYCSILQGQPKSEKFQKYLFRQTLFSIRDPARLSLLTVGRSVSSPDKRPLRYMLAFSRTF